MTDELDKLDKLAAIQVMGWEDHGAFWRQSPTIWPNPDERMQFKDSWQPTRNIAQAWECLEKTLKYEPFMTLKLCKGWHCEFYDAEECEIYGQAEGWTAAEAIVRACLAAKGVGER